MITCQPIHNEQHVVKGSTVHFRRPENIQHTYCPRQTTWVHILQGKPCIMLQQSYPIVDLTKHKTGGVTLNVAHHPASTMLCLHRQRNKDDGILMGATAIVTPGG